LKKGDILDLEISGYAFEGKGIAKIVKEVHSAEEEPKKFVVFVEGAYPGDVLSAQVGKIRKSYAEARIKNIHIVSSLRTKAACKHFGTCGGCKAQNLAYEHQAKFKEEQVKDIFERLGGLKDFELLPIVCADKIYFYRNKLEYSFGDKRWLSEDEISSMQEIPDRNFALGFHIPGMYDKVLNVEECHLQSDASNKILNFTRKFFKERSVSIYSTKTHEGFLRNLVIKQAANTSDLMVNLVVYEENDELLGEYKETLLSEVPAITTIVFNISKKKASIAVGDYEIVSYGNGYIIDIIGKSKYRISANSFFQTNTSQAEKLYNVGLDFAAFSGNEIVYDLYSGAGTIPIFISEKVKQIYGFESVEPAINDAIVNRGLNSVSNFEPILADLNKSFLPLVAQKNLPSPDVIITDPPRSGMHAKTVQDILSLNPAKVVYISCNPATQARDVKLLCDGGYELIKIQPVDMFPHTYHVENVALLVRNVSK